MPKQPKTPIETVYRYAYSARDGTRCLARVILFKRAEADDYVLLMLRCVGGAWPDRPELTEADVDGVPVCKGVLLSLDEEDEWRQTNLVPEA
jgi:hypothetical protein